MRHKKQLTATGRFPSEPEIQNLPGTPAHALEMYFARHGAPRREPEWEASRETCPRCDGPTQHQVYDGPGASQYRYRCMDCNLAWWADD